MDNPTPDYLAVDYPTILIDVADTAAIITFNRMDKYNALNAQMRRDIDDALSRIKMDPAIRSVILYGGTKAFMAGADVRELQSQPPLSVFSKMSANADIWEVVAKFPKPVIAAVAGPCVGGGLELAMASDLIVCADNAVLGQSELNVGLIPGRGGTQRLARHIGLPRAKEMILLGEMIDAETARAFGLVNRVVPVDRLLDEAKALASRIAEKSPQSVAMAKLMINMGHDLPLDTALVMESLAFSGMFTTVDMKEGIDAFLNKRRPNYVGR